MSSRNYNPLADINVLSEYWSEVRIIKNPEGSTNDWVVRNYTGQSLTRDEKPKAYSGDDLENLLTNAIDEEIIK